MELRRIPHDRVVCATSSAAIANVDTAGGRLIPLIMVDASLHPEVRELIRVHEYTAAGDCASQWATVVGNPNVVHLLLEFLRPVATTVTVEFALPELAGALDSVLRSKSMFLLEGPEGSTYRSTEGQPRILVELPTTGFEKRWDRMFHKSIANMMRDEGSTRRQADQRAQTFITRWRRSTTF